MASGRRQYPFHLIEPKWQRQWDEQQTFRAWNPGEAVPANHPFAERHAKARPEQLPKFYILDMFPYPSGAGLHVGHPEGYTATDILARYRRALGFNVLHPMGWDAFGLPAEQYAIKTGQHPRKTTEQNIATFKRQIKSLGFSYDWSRELDTTDPQYFKWTQWIFLQLYNSWFNPADQQGRAHRHASPTRPNCKAGQASRLPVPRASRPQSLNRNAAPTATPSAWPTSPRPPSGGASNSAPCSPTRKSWTARARSAASRSSASRCANGCCASPPTPSACCRTWTRSTGAIRSRKCSATGLGAAKARKWISRSRAPPRHDPRLHHPPGHAVRRDLHGARARA